MNRVIVSLLSILFLFASCGDNSSRLYDEGVSRELAMQRKSDYSSIQYTLFFDIPESRDSSIYGAVQIGFERVGN
ncbi:MAG: hypothetical protein MJZ16_14200, partial [Bacteroidales bacterium]|nr:hypothetical protein [Bacteroidales bacterium]